MTASCQVFYQKNLWDFFYSATEHLCKNKCKASFSLGLKIQCALRYIYNTYICFFFHLFSTDSNSYTQNAAICAFDKALPWLMQEPKGRTALHRAGSCSIRSIYTDKAFFLYITFAAYDRFLLEKSRPEFLDRFDCTLTEFCTQSR